MVKYETVIGTIGKTHGVRSESAPTVIASQINDQSEPPPIPPLLKTTGPVAVCAPFTEVCGFVPGAADCGAKVSPLVDVAAGVGDG